MKINLVVRREFVSRSEVQQLAGASALWEVAGVFNECVQGLGQLPIEKDRSLSGEIVLPPTEPA